MKQSPTYSLSEALTALAFEDPVQVGAVPQALRDGRWHCTRAIALSELVKALITICNGGYDGRVKIWGRPVNPSSQSPPAPLRKLSEAECLDCRKIVPGFDSLWLGESQLDEYDNAFDAHTSSPQFEDVQVDNADLEALRLKKKQSARKSNAQISQKNNHQTPLPEAELKRWWNSLSDQERELSRNELHKRCLVTYPENSIARQRIRDIEPRRKPGPRPIRP